VPTRRTKRSVRTLYRSLVGLLLLVAVAGCSSSAPIVTNEDADSQHFVDAIVPAIFTHWDVNALAAVADKTVYTPERLARARNHFAEWSERYGQFVAYHGSKGTTRILRTKDGETKGASYDADVTFTKKTVTVHVDAVKNNGKWLVESMSIQPLGHGNPAHH
jgi:hypothetical protein